jgi:hypothetical protein
MTTTTNLQNGIEDAGDDILGDLDPEDRARLVVEHAAAGDFDLVERLTETAPTYEYKATDLAFRDCLDTYHTLSLFALWRLERRAWRFMYERAQGLLAEANYDRFPDAEWTTEPTPDNEFHEAGAKRAAVRFLATHRAWERFVDEEIGVSLRAFLEHGARTSDTSAAEIIEIAATIITGDHLDEGSVTGWADTTVTHNGDEVGVDELADRKLDWIRGGVAPARHGGATRR